MSAPRPESPEAVRVEEHMGLAYTIARRYRVAGVDIDDLMQEAAIAMLRARQSWDPALSSWSNYAGLWIKQATRRHLQNHGAAVRVPVYLQERRRKAGEPMQAKVHSLDRTTGHKVGTIGLDEGNTFLDMLASPEQEDVDLPSLDDLISAAPTLTERQIRVLRLHAAGHDLAAIGRELGVSRERVRQIFLEAVRRVRVANDVEVEDNIQRSIAKFDESRARAAKAQRGRAA